jgi:hypothetical protein
MRGNPFTTLALAAAAFAVLAVARPDAASVEHMTLRELVDRADRIVRGTVVVADESTVTAGGGTLPIVIYRIRVSEVLKGAGADGDLIDIRLLSTGKLTTAAARSRSLLRDLPQFRVGQEYLFALTRPSAIGLSTTVGLGQGLFEVRGAPGREEAVNQWNNLGLLSDSLAVAGAPAARSARRVERTGPLPYATLVNEIRARLAR